MRILSVLIWFAVAMSSTPTIAQNAPYVLREEWQGSCARADPVDVNLGNAPDAFVRAVNCQVWGRFPTSVTQVDWTNRLLHESRLRRIDVAKALCAEAGRKCRFAYSDPWIYRDEVTATACQKRFKRDIGAVVMFFFHCPDGVNCGQGWASNHVRGMKTPDTSLEWHGTPGYYVATNPGFWRRQLQDAKRAGLQFILPNLYGPDMRARGEIDTLAAALTEAVDPVRLGLFDDSWAWGVKEFGRPWSTAPDMADTDIAAETLYLNKWKPYFFKDFKGKLVSYRRASGHLFL